MSGQWPYMVGLFSEMQQHKFKMEINMFCEILMYRVNIFNTLQLFYAASQLHNEILQNPRDQNK